SVVGKREFQWIFLLKQGERRIVGLSGINERRGHEDVQESVHLARWAVRLVREVIRAGNRVMQSGGGLERHQLPSASRDEIDDLLCRRKRFWRHSPRSNLCPRTY